MTYPCCPPVSADLGNVDLSCPHSATRHHGDTEMKIQGYFHSTTRMAAWSFQAGMIACRSCVTGRRENCFTSRTNIQFAKR